MKKFAWALSLLALLALPAAAQHKKVGENPIYRKTTVYSFEVVTIESECYQAAWDFVRARRPAKLPSLIRVREEFKDKVMRSVGDL